MTQTLDAIYDGTVIRPDHPLPLAPNTRIRIVVNSENEVDLRTLGIDETQAAELRARLSTFEDWNHPDMDAYGNYDEALKELTPIFNPLKTAQDW